VKRNGTLWCSLSGCLPARLLCILLGFVLLLLPSLSYAESLNDYLDNIELNLTAILAYSQSLEEELQNSRTLSEMQKQQIEQLLSELSGLKSRLEISRTLLDRYRNRVTELLNSIGELQTKLQTLSETYAASEASWKKTVDQAVKESRARKIKTGLAVAGALLLGFGIGKLMK
jgi:chromosome segregation ATPase